VCGKQLPIKKKNPYCSTQKTKICSSNVTNYDYAARKGELLKQAFRERLWSERPDVKD
jgi:hypothetical protein